MDDEVILRAVASELNKELKAFATFDDEQKTRALVSKLATSICRDISASQIKLSVQFSLRKANPAEAVASFRELLPEVPALESAAEVQYRTVVLGEFDGDDTLAYSRQAEWRTGRRVVRDGNEDEDEGEIVHAFGSNQGIRTEPLDALLPSHFDFVIDEMLERVQRAANGGISGL